MSKVKVKIVFLGHIPYSIDLDKIRKWKSDLFEILKPINTVAIVGNSDGANWEFLDTNIEEQLPQRDGADILIAVTNVPLQHSYFARRFTDNRACMTFSEMTEILKFDNIPLENLLLRVIYSVSFVYRRYGNRIPLMAERTNFAHDETRGCIFDMNAAKTDVIYSLNKPQLCPSCIETLTTIPKYKVEKELIEKVQKELKKIKKGLYFEISDFVKRKPILSLIISAIVAIILGTIGSLTASLLWEKFLK